MSYNTRLIHLTSRNDLTEHLRKAGVDPEGVNIINEKLQNIVIRVDGIPSPAANILKQQMLSLGGDAAVHRDVIKGKRGNTTLYVVGDLRKLLSLPGKLKYQPFGLPELGEKIIKLLDIHVNFPTRIKLSKGEIKLADTPLIMGVINVTPDSFSDGGLYFDAEKALKRAMEMVEEGADIIDVGAESSRPGSKNISTEEELSRIQPVLQRLFDNTDIPISIDTRKSRVAEAAIEKGVEIVNDISGLRDDPDMARTIARSGVAVIVMHMRGNPETMQDNPFYEDTITEIIDWLKERTDELSDKGIDREKIIIDPGIGFGKRLRDNLEILERIGDLRTLGFPIVIGYSRKSFLGMVTGRNTDERIWGGFAALAKCIEGGASIVRVHDVRQTRDFLRVWRSIEKRETVS